MSADGSGSGASAHHGRKLTKDTALSFSYYEIFNLSPTIADRDINVNEIKRAYRRFSLLFHPDKDPSDQARTAFEYICTATETLLDPEMRRAYDAELNQSRSHASHSAGSFPYNQNPQFPFAPGHDQSATGRFREHDSQREQLHREAQLRARRAEEALLAREREHNKVEAQKRRRKADAEEAAAALVNELRAVNTPFAAVEEAMVRDWDVDDDLLAMKLNEVEDLLKNLRHSGSASFSISKTKHSHKEERTKRKREEGEETVIV